MEEMNITEAQYHRILVDENTYENTAIVAVINGQSMTVGIDPANRHYAEIMRQVEAGTLTIADADPIEE